MQNSRKHAEAHTDPLKQTCEQHSRCFLFIVTGGNLIEQSKSVAEDERMQY